MDESKHFPMSKKSTISIVSTMKVRMVSNVGDYIDGDSSGGDVIMRSLAWTGNSPSTARTVTQSKVNMKKS